MNRVVYDSQPNNTTLAEKKTNADTDEPSEKPLPSVINCDNCAEFEEQYKPSSTTDFTLQFESRFESGNLRRAIQVYVFEYDLIL